MSFWDGKRVLVTGGAGLMGRPLRRSLAALGAAVRDYDIVDGQDILDLGDLQNAVAGVDAVIHLAAMSNVEVCRKAGYAAYQNIVVGTLNVLEACRAYNPQMPVVVASSNHVYGEQKTLPVSENAPLNQLDTYSAAKIAADYLARSYAHNYGVNVVIMRSTNCFGPNDPHSGHIVPSTITAVLNGKAPVIKSNGFTKKSYLYVDDVIDAYIAAAEWVGSGPYRQGTVFNVSDTPVSVLDLVHTILKVMGATVKPEVLGIPNDQHDEDLNDSFIRKATGWKPKHTLQEAIALTVAGFKERHGSLSHSTR